MSRTASFSWPAKGQGTTDVSLQTVLRTTGLTVQHVMDLVAACTRQRVDRATLVNVAVTEEGDPYLEVIVTADPTA